MSTDNVGRDFVEDFLAHYADPNYDPAKAHEYYMENRQLKSGGRKGRAPKAPKGPKGPSAEVLAKRAAAETKKHQREAIRNSHQRLAVEKKNEMNNAANANTARLEQMRQTAEATRQRITDALNQRLAEISAKANLKFDETKLIPIPANASDKVRQYLEQQNARRLQVANRQQQTAQANANREKSAATQAAQKAAQAEMRKVGTDLRDAVAKARIDYANAKAQMVEKYKQAAASEQANIERTVR